MKCSIDTTNRGEGSGPNTVFFTIATRAPELNRCSSTRFAGRPEGHMDALTTRRHAGRLHAGSRALRRRKVIDRLKKPVAIHCHQDFGLGVANIPWRRWRPGLGFAHTTITGLGRARRQRADGRLSSCTLLALHDSTGIKREKFVESPSSSWSSGEGHAAAQPSELVGDKLYEVESGINRRLGPYVPEGSPARVRCRSFRSVGQSRVNIVLARTRTSVDRRVGRKDRHQDHGRGNAWRSCWRGKGEVVREEDLLTAEVQGNRRSRVVKNRNSHAGVDSSSETTNSIHSTRLLPGVWDFVMRHVHLGCDRACPALRSRGHLRDTPFQ